MFHKCERDYKKAHTTYKTYSYYDNKYYNQKQRKLTYDPRYGYTFP